MAFLTRNELLPTSIQASSSARLALRSRFTANSQATTVVFLSHSHNDAVLIEQFLAILAKEGISVYLDWKDPTMPSVTSPETARQLKYRIKKCRKFLLLATNNALSSHWVQWELGIADSQNGMKNVAIIPVEDYGSVWKGREYIGIYSRVEKADNGKLGVFEPGKNDGGMLLKTWLDQPNTPSD